jgi:hypothetical protein
VPLVAALDVDRLVCGYGVQPRPHLPTLVEQVAFQVNLHEGRLEGVLGQNLIVQESPQVAV